MTKKRKYRLGKRRVRIVLEARNPDDPKAIMDAIAYAAKEAGGKVTIKPKKDGAA